MSVFRPANVLLAAAAVLLGASAGGRGAGEGQVWRAAAAAALAAAAGYAFNDTRDVERDRRNKPWRALAAGAVRGDRVLVLAAGLALGGWVLSWSAGFSEGLLVTAWFTLLGVYEIGAKGTVLWGNVLVSAVAASAFLLGGLAVDRPVPSLIPALYAFLFHLGRELWKDAADVKGDAASGTRTLAVARGPRAAVRLGGAVFALVVALSPAPYLWAGYSILYLVVVVGSVDVLLVALTVKMCLQPTPEEAARAEVSLKFGMVAGLCALALGPL